MTEPNIFVDPNIASTERAFPMQGRYAYLRYDMNENPEGLPKEFVDSVLAEITPEFLSIYPEPDAFLNKYADYMGVSRENVVATNGTDTAIRYLLQTFCGKGHEVITVSPSFEMYWVNCNILGLKHVPVTYNDDLTINVDRIIDAITPATDIVVLLNPNNPVGNVYTDEEATAIIDAAERNHTLVIVDEAYQYFYDHSFLDIARGRKNVAILRTFSKLFSIASLRLGVIISSPEVIHYVENAKLTFDANALALKFGERIMDNKWLIKDLMAKQQGGKDYTLSTLAGAGYEVRDCRGNFIFVRTKRNAAQVARELQDEKKVLVKYWSSGMLAPYLRVSTGSVEAMRKFVEPFLEVDSR